MNEAVKVAKNQNYKLKDAKTLRKAKRVWLRVG